jgi:hypothetical protein
VSFAMIPVLPIAAATSIPEPLSGAWLGAIALLPAVVLWVVLAALRVWREDGVRHRRKARRELRTLLRLAARRAGHPTASELECWRKGVRRLWLIESAAPTSDEVAARGGDALAVLWLEMEEALYSRAGGLAPDWVARACAAVEACSLPPVRWPVPKRRRHWLPLVTCAALLLGGVKLKGAELLDPTDWVERERAARSAVSEEQWGAATAHWTAAYLVAPRERPVEEGLRAALAKMEIPETHLVRLLNGRWDERVASRLSPAEWGRVARLGAIATSVALLALVGWVYFGRGRRPRQVFLVAAVLAGGISVFAWESFRRYGPLADARAAMSVRPAELRAIPSEIGARQPAATLTPGTVVVVDRSFLGWEHVTVRGDLTGWIRTEQAVWLYRKRNYADASAEYAQ